MQRRVELKPGDVVLLKMGASEACMHMGIVGQEIWVEVLERGAQLYKDGRPFSFPITHGEAGIYTLNGPTWYAYREIPDAATTPAKPITRDDMPPLIGEVVRVKGEDRWGRVKIGFYGPAEHAGKFGVDFADQDNVFNTTQELMPFDAVVSAFSDYPRNIWPSGYVVPAHP